MPLSRLEDQMTFVERTGWGNADLFPLPSDASFRSYIRLIRDGESRMLMDAPPAMEKLPEYLRINKHLADLGLRVPRIYADDQEQGFALIEDFGDDTFTRLLEKGHSEHDLYLKAVDVLVKLHTSGRKATKIDVPDYDMDTLLEEVELFVDWFVPAARGEVASVAEKEAYMQVWRAALANISQDRSVLVLRDYHVDNLMILPESSAAADCGLLDFQDALIGARAYDLMSLIEDARRDVSAGTKAAVLERYFSRCPDVVRTEIAEDMALLGAQRHAKVAGIFLRLSRRDSKPLYLGHMPRVLKLLSQSLEHPQLNDVRKMIEKLVPGYEAIRSFGSRDGRSTFIPLTMSIER